MLKASYQADTHFGVGRTRVRKVLLVYNDPLVDVEELGNRGLEVQRTPAFRIARIMIILVGLPKNSMRRNSAVSAKETHKIYPRGRQPS